MFWGQWNRFMTNKWNTLFKQRPDITFLFQRRPTISSRRNSLIQEVSLFKTWWTLFTHFTSMPNIQKSKCLLVSYSPGEKVCSVFFISTSDSISRFKRTSISYTFINRIKVLWKSNLNSPVRKMLFRNLSSMTKLLWEKWWRIFRKFSKTKAKLTTMTSWLK